MYSKLFKILIVCLAAIVVLFIVSHMPLVYLGGRGIAGKGIFIHINEYTFYGLAIYTMLFCVITSLILKIPKLVLVLCSFALTVINLSILIIDTRTSQYTMLIEKIILDNYGPPKNIEYFGYSAFVIGCILLLFSVYIFSRCEKLSLEHT